MLFQRSELGGRTRLRRQRTTCEKTKTKLQQITNELLKCHIHQINQQNNIKLQTTSLRGLMQHKNYNTHLYD